MLSEEMLEKIKNQAVANWDVLREGLVEKLIKNNSIEDVDADDIMIFTSSTIFECLMKDLSVSHYRSIEHDGKVVNSMSDWFAESIGHQKPV